MPPPPGRADAVGDALKFRAPVGVVDAALRDALREHKADLMVLLATEGVRSRAELLARWVRRGWGGRFAWAD
jgi:hypothetical protein